MPVLLQINQIHKAYGANVILDDATASFSSDQKIGMIGRNGAGKSTLCRIITGHEQADDGSISRNSALKLSYLEQHDTFNEGESVLDFLMRTTGAEAWQCGQTAARFHVPNEMLELPVRELPGGYQTRVKLTAMLLGSPNFLVLDEPSNYLDLSTLILLENFLTDFRGGYLIVSHDREFLKRTCDHTLELENGDLTLYPGDIEEYFEFKETLLAQKEAYNRSVQKKREQLQEFVNRFRAKASTASRAQSKMKQMEKLKTIEIAHELGTVRIHMPAVERKSGIAFSCEDLEIGYPEKTVASKIHFQIDRGEHVAILGDNGQGKTTFLKTIAGDLPARGGSFRWNSSLKTGYYAQHVFSALNAEDTVYAHLARESAEGVTSQEIFDMAGCFLFKGEDVKKKVKVLSGGERSRLVLAGLLLSKSQALLLDEPTNHLDFETVEALARALKNFAGVVFFISHDRTFVNLVATTILEVKNSSVRRYPGSYEDYVYRLENAAREEKSHLGRPAPAAKQSSQTAAKQSSQTAAKQSSQTDSSHPGPHASTKEKSLPEEQTGGGPSSKTPPKAGRPALEKLLKAAEQRLKSLTEEREKLLQEFQTNPFFYSKARNKRLKELQLGLEQAEADRGSLQKQREEMK